MDSEAWYRFMHSHSKVLRNTCEFEMTITLGIARMWAFKRLPCDACRTSFFPFQSSAKVVSGRLSRA